MPSFGARSLRNLSTCHHDLQMVAQRAIKIVPADLDFAVICGHRGKAAQEEAVRLGRSWVHWPLGKHNAYPSNAMDLAPYPIDWDDLDRFKELAAVILQTASQLHIPLIWGGLFDLKRPPDKRRRDYPHYQRVT